MENRVLTAFLLRFFINATALTQSEKMFIILIRVERFTFFVNIDSRQKEYIYSAFLIRVERLVV